MYRRSSYASVAAGTASTYPPSLYPPARSGTLTQPENPESGDSTPPYSQTRQASPGIAMDVGVKIGHQQLGNAQGDGYDEPEIHRGPQFFVPSYLRHSRYIERLEIAHEAQQQILRESRQSHRHSGLGGSRNTSSSNLQSRRHSGSHGNRAPVQDVIERLPPITPDGPRLLPSRWNESDRCSGLELLADGSEVRFTGVSKTPDDAAAVRSDHPMPREAGIYYFEITILSRGKEGLIGVGFSGHKPNLNRLPGWESESWGYHGDDGFSFACSASGGKHYGPKFSSLDVIGCGVNFRTGTAFFTKNGIFLGDAFQNIKSDRLYPSVGIKKPGEHLRINFGQTPFVYDIDSMMEKEKMHIRSEINQPAVHTLPTNIDETTNIQDLVAQYLAHEGYVETARDFAKDVQEQRQTLHSGQESSLLDTIDDVNAINRQKIRAAILNGDIDKALKFLGAYFPHVLEKDENRDMYFKLRCRKFIEMMRRCTELQSASDNTIGNGRSERSNDYNSHTPTFDDHQMEVDDQLQREAIPNPVIEGEEVMDTADPVSTKSAAINHSNLLNAAIQYGMELQAEFSTDSRPTVKKALNDTFALIAYTDARESVLGDLMEGKGRVEIAEQVNGAILVSLGKPRSAYLEKLCAQTEVLVDMLSGSGGAGAFVNVKEDYLR